MLFKIAFTGHRPGKLPNIAAVKSQVSQFLSRQLKLHPDLLVISGGALGADQLAAEVCIELGIPFVFVLPFPVSIFTARWNSSSRAHLRYLISHAVRTFVVQSTFSMSGYQRRNEVMVRHSNLLCAVWNGSSGGTANTVRYAQSVGREIHFIRP
ncbi:MAG: hypothetical protein DRN29_04855 [Thermoplasmata archaeon]|nr:MAG: hypothetical protein DRN29_04855 [Thermoplasmata archaeon]